MKAAAAYVGPLFIRAGRAEGAGDLRGRIRNSRSAKPIELMDGADVTLIATGLLVAESIRAAETLEAEGISARVIDMHTIKPLDRDAIARAAEETGAIVVAEEHLVDCGLGVRVAQVVAETHPAAMEFVGIQNTYAESATPDELLDKYGLRRAMWPRRRAAPSSASAEYAPHVPSKSQRIAAPGRRTIRNALQASRRGPRAARRSRPPAFRRRYPAASASHRPSGDRRSRRACAERTRRSDGRVRA